MFRAEPAVVSAHKTQPKHSSGKHVISATFCRRNNTSEIIRDSLFYEELQIRSNLDMTHT